MGHDESSGLDAKLLRDVGRCALHADGGGVLAGHPAKFEDRGLPVVYAVLDVVATVAVLKPVHGELDRLDPPNEDALPLLAGDTPFSAEDSDGLPKCLGARLEFRDQDASWR